MGGDSRVVVEDISSEDDLQGTQATTGSGGSGNMALMGGQAAGKGVSPKKGPKGDGWGRLIQGVEEGHLDNLPTRKPHKVGGAFDARSPTSMSATSTNVRLSASRRRELKKFERLRHVTSHDAEYLLDVSGQTGDGLLAHKNIRLMVTGHLGILMMVGTQIMAWDFNNSSHVVWEEHKELYIAFTFLKIAICLSTLICCVQIFNFHYTYAQWMVGYEHYTTPSEAIIRTKRWVKMLLELLIHLLIPLPFFENIPGLGDKLGLFMLLRTYTWLRYLRDHSDIYAYRRVIIASHPLYRKTRPKIGTFITFMAFAYENTVTFIILGVVVLCLCASFAIWVVERDLNPQFYSFLDTIYFSVVTMTTIGYGDIAPRHFWGRMVAMLQGIWGIIIVTMLGSLFVHKLSPSKEQGFAVAFVRGEQTEKIMHGEYIRLLQITWRYRSGKIGIREWSRKWVATLRKIHRLRGDALLYERKKNELYSNKSAAGGVEESSESEDSDDQYSEEFTDYNMDLQKNAPAEGGGESLAPTPAASCPPSLRRVSLNFAPTTLGGGGSIPPTPVRNLEMQQMKGLMERLELKMEAVTGIQSASAQGESAAEIFEAEQAELAFKTLQKEYANIQRAVQSLLGALGTAPATSS